MGGADRGTYFLPEVDDQLLVVFEHGDVDRPIVIGALWSKKQEPVEVNESGKNNTKLIKSRAGHRIIFDDKEGAEKVIVVDKTKKNKIVLDSANKVVKIECAGDIEIKAAENVVMHSNTLKVGTTEKLTRQGQVGARRTRARPSGSRPDSKSRSAARRSRSNTSHSAATSVSGSGSRLAGRRGVSRSGKRVAGSGSRQWQAAGGRRQAAAAAEAAAAREVARGSGQRLAQSGSRPSGFRLRRRGAGRSRRLERSATARKRIGPPRVDRGEPSF